MLTLEVEKCLHTLLEYEPHAGEIWTKLYDWQSIDAILEDVSVTETIV